MTFKLQSEIFVQLIQIISTYWPNYIKHADNISNVASISDVEMIFSMVMKNSAVELTVRLRLYEIRTGADLQSGPVLPSVYTDTTLRRAVANRIFCRSCHASFGIFLHHSKSNRTQKNAPLDVNKLFGSVLGVYTRTFTNRYRPAPLRILMDVMAIVTT